MVASSDLSVMNQDDVDTAAMNMAKKSYIQLKPDRYGGVKISEKTLKAAKIDITKPIIIQLKHCSYGKDLRISN
jgi:hypothetical protein